MQSRPEIFVVTAVLLVPFIYATSSIPDACAVPPDPRFGGSDTDFCMNSPESLSAVCCWTEEDDEGIEIQVCQICALNTQTGNFDDCGEVHQAFKGPLSSNDITQDKGGVLEDPTTLSQENNMTFFKSNLSFPQSNNSDDNTNNTLALLQSGVENDAAENKKGTLVGEEEKDESEENEDSNEEEDE